MSAWHSLQGYLGYRPSGALGRFKAKKRQWFVLDDRHCQLLVYKTEAEASAKKPPLGDVQLRTAAISLNTQHPNQFVIHSRGKEHVFTAETHESTMIWLLALQAKRDAFHNKSTPVADHGAAEFEAKGLKRKESLPSDQEIQQMIRRAMCAESEGVCCADGSPGAYGNLFRSQSVREHCRSSSSASSSASSVATHNFRKKVFHHSLRRSVDLGSVKSCGADFGSSFGRHVRTCSGGSVATTDSEDTDASCCHLRGSCSPRMPDGDPMDSREEPPTRTGSPLRTLSLISDDVDEEDGLARGTTSDRERIKELQDDLLLSKIELAKAMCKEEDFLGVLQSKDAVIQHLEGQLRDGLDLRPRADDVPAASTNQRLEEKCRIIQNQNRFLNEEILKLSRMWQQEQMTFSQQSQKIEELEAELDRLKRDYVFLLQSSVRIAGGDGPDFIEVPIYGGARHKERVGRLLEEARKCNPSLPSLDGMAKSGCHVDAFGFKHCYINEGLMLHYLCGRLNQHYEERLNRSEDSQKLWKEVLKGSGPNGLPRTKEVKRLVRAGIPSHLRARVWGILIRDKVSAVKENKGALYYNHLCSSVSDSEAVCDHRRQISLDLFRTMPGNVHFNENEADGIQKMQEVLQAFCLHNPNVGYCQGMNFIVGMALLFMKAEDAFWFLVAITERYFPPYYFDQNLMGAQADQEVLKNVLELKLPALHRHLATLDIELSTITLNWFLAVFFESVPFDTLLRMWDCFLYEGPKVLFRFSLAILRMSENSLLDCNNTIAVMRQLKASSKLCYDVEGLMRTAFVDLKPFPRRAEIVSKQACYLKTLKEKYRRRGEEKDASDSKEKLLDGLGSNDGEFSIECAAVYGDSLLICEGQQQEGRVLRVSCDRMTKSWLNIQFDSRIMCVHVMPEADLLVFGTLSHHVCAYSLSNRELAWRVILNDAVLSMCSQADRGKWSLYAALADGTLAVVECPKPDNRQMEQDVFYILIGSGPLTCLAVVERRLWCACGNRIVILHAKTLDTIDQFTVSTNPLDIVSGITESRYGVFVLLRGLTIFQLWDPQNLVCRTLFDTKDNRCSRLAQESPFGAASRVTALLPYEESLWVGTADGYLLVYDVQLLPSCKPSAFNSPSHGGPMDVTSMDLVTERIQELYLRQADPSPGPQRGRSDSGYQTVGDGSKDSSVVPDSGGAQPDPCRAPCPAEPVDAASDSDAGSSAAASTMRGSSVTSAADAACFDRRRNTLACIPSVSESGFRGCSRDPDPQPRRLRSAGKRRRRRSEGGFDRGAAVKSRTWSFGDVTHLLTGSGESLGSFPRCDSFDFDDVFATHTEDELWWGRKLSGTSDSRNRGSRRTSGSCGLADEGSGRTSAICGSTADCSTDRGFIDRGLTDRGFTDRGFTDRGLTDRGFTDSNFGTTNESPLVILVEPCRTNSSASSADPALTDMKSGGHLAVGQPGRPNRINIPPPQKSSSISSLDDLSSPASHVEYDSVQDCSRRSTTTAGAAAGLTNWKESDSCSFVSFTESEVPYNVELMMREKIKASGQPMRCLLAVQCGGEPAIFSCGGSCTDPDAILRWTPSKRADSKMETWDCAAVEHACPRPSLEPKNGLHRPLDQWSRGPLTTTSFVHATSNLVGNSLAKVHDIISNLSSDATGS